MKHQITPRLILICFVGIALTQAYPTTVVVFVSSRGIAIATDSKVVAEGRNSAEAHRKKVGEIQRAKDVIVKNRFVVATIGHETIRFYNPKTKMLNHYDFATWIHGVESRLPNDVTFDGFVAIINSETRQIVPLLHALVTDGGMEQENPTNLFDMPMQYVIAGFQDGIPRVSIIEFYIDWNAKTVLGPFSVSLEPSPEGGPITGRTGLYRFGVVEAIADFTNRNSYAYKQAMIISPETMRDYMSSGRPFPLDEGITLSRILVQIEEHTNPDLVGGDARIIAILPDGKALESLESLPQGPTTKQKKVPK